MDYNFGGVNQMPKGQGRPTKIDQEILFQILIKYKNKIIKRDFRTVSKKSTIWTIISE